MALEPQIMLESPANKSGIEEIKMGLKPQVVFEGKATI